MPTVLLLYCFTMGEAEVAETVYAYCTLYYCFTITLLLLYYTSPASAHQAAFPPFSAALCSAKTFFFGVCACPRIKKKNVCVCVVCSSTLLSSDLFFLRAYNFFLCAYTHAHTYPRARTHTHTHTQAHMTHMHAHMHRHTDRDRQNSQVCISHLTTKKMYY